MVVGIVAYNNWYCKQCHKKHNILYVHGKKAKYCEYCVPPEVKQQAVYINQNREKIDYNGEN